MSPKTGRPKVDNPKYVRYSIRLDQETEDRLKAYCEKHNMKRGEAVRYAVEKLLKEA